MPLLTAALGVETSSTDTWSDSRCERLHRSGWSDIACWEVWGVGGGVPLFLEQCVESWGGPEVGAGSTLKGGLWKGGLGEMRLKVSSSESIGGGEEQVGFRKGSMFKMNSILLVKMSVDSVEVVARG